MWLDSSRSIVAKDPMQFALQPAQGRCGRCASCQMMVLYGNLLYGKGVCSDTLFVNPDLKRMSGLAHGGDPAGPDVIATG